MGKGTKECRLWHDMMYRTNYKYVKKNPSYIGSTVAERWLSFENFYLDIMTMIGFNEFDELNKPFALDKDLFGKGSKIYSKDNCVFIPHSINKFLANVYKKKGELPSE